jgi:hypothetical protein
MLKSIAPIRPALGHPASDITEKKNCTDIWTDKFAKATDGTGAVDVDEVCVSACGDIGRVVEVNEWVVLPSGDKRRVCVCSAVEEEKKNKKTKTPKTDDDTRSCAVAGLRPSDDDSMPTCPCAQEMLPYAQLVMLAVYALFLLVLACCGLVQCCAQLCVCVVGCTRRVKSDDDIHWAKCCCSAGGAFCCVPTAKLPAIRTSSSSIFALVAVDVCAAYFGFPGLGIALMGYTASNATPMEHRNAYYRVGLMYICSTFLIGVLYVSVVFAGVAVVLQTFVSYCYICSISALLRLPCKKEFAHRWLSPDPATAPLSGSMVTIDPEVALDVPFMRVAATPISAQIVSSPYAINNKN